MDDDGGSRFPRIFFLLLLLLLLLLFGTQIHTALSARFLSGWSTQDVSDLGLPFFFTLSFLSEAGSDAALCDRIVT